MGGTQENWVTHQNSWNPHLKHHLQLKTKKDVGSNGLGPQRGGRQLTWRWKSECLVNKHLLGPAETVGHREEFYKQTFLGSSLSTHLVHTRLSMVTAPFLEQVLYLHALDSRWGGRSKFLPESFGLWLFSAWNNLHAEELFWGGKFCSPITVYLYSSWSLTGVSENKKN